MAKRVKTANSRNGAEKKPRKKPTRREHLFQPGKSGNPTGRKKGTRNKVTIEVRAAAAAIVDDPEYRKNLAVRAKAGTLAPQIECLLWHYAKGKPVERFEHSGPDGKELKQVIVIGDKRIEF